MLPHQCDAADGQFGFPFVMWKNADAVLFGSLALPRAHGELRPLRANDPTPRRFYSVYWKGVTGGTDSSPTLRWREMDSKLQSLIGWSPRQNANRVQNDQECEAVARAEIVERLGHYRRAALMSSPGAKPASRTAPG